MTFAFNYGDETVDISELASEMLNLSYGGSKIGPSWSIDLGNPNERNSLSQDLA